MFIRIDESLYKNRHHLNATAAKHEYYITDIKETVTFWGCADRKPSNNNPNRL